MTIGKPKVCEGTLFSRFIKLRQTCSYEQELMINYSPLPHITSSDLGNADIQWSFVLRFNNFKGRLKRFVSFHQQPVKINSKLFGSHEDNVSL
jgi:hypothetical protein